MTELFTTENFPLASECELEHDQTESHTIGDWTVNITCQVDGDSWYTTDVFHKEFGRVQYFGDSPEFVDEIMNQVNSVVSSVKTADDIPHGQMGEEDSGDLFNESNLDDIRDAIIKLADKHTTGMQNYMIRCGANYLTD